MVPVAPRFLSVTLDICFGSWRDFTVKLYFPENGTYREIKGEAEQIRERFLITKNVWGGKRPEKGVSGGSVSLRWQSSVGPDAPRQALPSSAEGFDSYGIMNHKQVRITRKALC